MFLETYELVVGVCLVEMGSQTGQGWVRRPKTETSVGSVGNVDSIVVGQMNVLQEQSRTKFEDLDGHNNYESERLRTNSLVFHHDAYVHNSSKNVMG